VKGLETGSYSDSEAPDAPERCRINELGTSRGSSTCVAARMGETDILVARVMMIGNFFSSANHLFGSIVVSSTDLLSLGLGCRKADKKMSTTDAVAIFAEGTFEDQVRDV
jgi:hypothetical protein